MLKTFTKIAALTAVAFVSQNSVAQNLLAEKPIFTLGPAMTWSNGDASYTFVTADLAKLVAVPANTTNVYLYPENGDINNAENQAKGAQPFYIDMESVQEVAIVSTTWEGAAADSYNIFLTNDEPTLATLETTPTYTATGLGQYTENNAILPEGSKGRYMVFQVTKATNWGWGVKIRSIAAVAPADDVLTSFTLSTGFAPLGVETAVTCTFKNQNGIDIAADKVNVTVSDNATYADGKLTINSGNSAVFTAAMGNETLTATVYAPTAPAVPDAADILTPIYTNGNTEYNGTAGFIVAYNGGATELGRMTFSNGEVAAGFGNTRCVFFYNNDAAIMGGWNETINPDEKNYGYLHLSIYGTKDVTGNVVFERTTLIGDNHPITLKAGEWNNIEIPLNGETSLYTMSVRFDADNTSDILLSNIYFSPLVDEGDEDAPVFGEISAEAYMTGVNLTFSATDAARNIYFTINDGTNNYQVNAKPGDPVSYTVTGLTPDTEYTFTITASDGKNKATETTVAKTFPMSIPAAPEAHKESDYMRAVFCPSMNIIPEGIHFDNWGSHATGEMIKDAAGNDVFYLSNYEGQWGGIVGFDLEIGDATDLRIDIYGDAVEGDITIYPVWNAEIAAQAEGTHIVKTIVPNQWNSIDIPLTEFNYTVDSGHPVFQIAFTNSTLKNFAVGNIYFWSDNKITTDSESIVVAEETGVVDVYTLQGIKVRAGVEKATALDNLPSGLYIVGGKKTVK